jgi:hypothetical protein
MTIDDVIENFSSAGNDLPEASMRWALDNWDAALPRFLALLEAYADGVERSDEAADAMLFIIHLIGEKGEAAAFPALCRLLKATDASEAALGDAITDGLNRILISAYNGDAARLQDLIEQHDADQFVRAAALEAMAHLAAHGALGRDAMRSYMLRLFEDMQPRGESFLWSAWALMAANLGYADFASRVEELLQRGFIDETDMNLHDFNEQLGRTLADPRREAGFAFDRIAPFEDAIGTLSGWYGFSEQANIEAARAAARPSELPGRSPFDAPSVNVNRHVGRNDPCPCGSGKKYKKCCLV